MKHHFRKYLPLLLGPLCFICLVYLPILNLDEKIVNVIGITSWMLIWWISEVVALPVTAFLPVVLFPALGILDLPTTSANYTNPTVLLFLAGFVFALSIEKHRLHERIALHIINWIGTSIQKIVLGFMLATAFISMWVNNTATTLLMFPIANSVLSLLQESFVAQKQQEAFNKLSKSLLLGLAFSACIGGIATPIGTPTNAVLIAYLKENFHTDISFLAWFAIGFPLAVVMLSFAYFVLAKWLFVIEIDDLPSAKQIVEDKIAHLGAITYQEYAVSGVFLLTTFTWIFRVFLIKIPALAFLNDTIIGMAGALLLFIIPNPTPKDAFIFEWKNMEKLPWGILFMIGGGLALAKTLETSGLVQLIGNSIKHLGINHFALILAIVIGVTLLLKIMIANTALATILVPMVAGIAVASGIEPILLAAPTTFAASFAFILPMSTPPNAIVLSTGFVQVKDMIKAGSWIAIFGFLLLIGVYKCYIFMI